MNAPTVALATVLLILAASEPSLAHDAIDSAGPLVNGILHPMMVPAHILILLALALWIGGQSSWNRRSAIVAFAIALAGGLAVAQLGSLEPALLATAALAVGLFAATAWTPPMGIVVLSAIGAGCLIGLDSGIDDPIVAIGLWVGAHLVFLAIVGVTMRIEMGWLKIGVRIAGAWIAAIALLLLAVTLKR